MQIRAFCSRTAAAQQEYPDVEAGLP